MKIFLNWRGQLLVGLLALLCGLLLQSPAALVYEWAKPKEGALPVALLGVQGEVLSGSASGVVIKNRPALNSLTWELNPLWLLVARLSADLKAEAEQTVLDTQLALWPGSRLQVSHLNFSGSIKTLLAAAGQPYLPLDGMVRIAEADIALKDNWPRSAEGLAQIQSLAWTLAASPIQLGDFEAALSTENKEIIATLSALSGPLELTGEARLKPDQSYAVDIAYRPKPDASAVLRNLLSSNGSPDASGWYHFKQQRQAPPPAP